MAGPPGPPGPAATIQVGTVVTGAAGTNVVIQNSGTNSAAIFDFVIPRGDTGVGTQGPSGPPGASVQGPQGDIGPTGSAGPQGVAGSRIIGGSGFPSNAVGVDGDYFLDQSNALLYGPKVSGVWSGTFIDLKAALGTAIPLASAFTGVVGTSGLAARQDHVHPTPAFIYEDFTPLTGTAITISDPTSFAVLSPASTLATLTVNLPPASTSYNGKVVEIFIQNFGITTPTTQATGCVIRGPLPSPAAGGYRFRYRASNTTWYRVN